VNRAVRELPVTDAATPHLFLPGLVYQHTVEMGSVFKTRSMVLGLVLAPMTGKNSLVVSDRVTGNRAWHLVAVVGRLKDCCLPERSLTHMENDMATKKIVCPDCAADNDVGLDRRDFLKAASVGVAAASLPLWATATTTAAPTPTSPAETAVKVLFDSLNDNQRKTICFPWDYQDPKRGLLRTRVANNWQITAPHIRSPFYTKEQQTIVHDIFKGIINPQWYARFLKQLRDDTGGKEWGNEQSIAIFGTPGSDKFEFVMTGRHMTVRADGHSENHVAFGGPIFYGHAASGFNEKPGHPGNVFWEQGRKANLVYQMLDGRQRKLALVESRPDEAAVSFRGASPGAPGIPVTELSPDQKAELQRILLCLVEPYRKEDQEEALECLKRQGGLDKCSLAFYREGDIGNDGEWDNWRIEGPAFVWYFRGEPHVHVRVNVADDPSRTLNA
jgi:hypothetical protein